MPLKSTLKKLWLHKIPIALALTISAALLFFYANSHIPQSSEPFIFEEIPKPLQKVLTSFNVELQSFFSLSKYESINLYLVTFSFTILSHS